MKEFELRQMFKNLSDCYADTGRFENDGSYTEGEVIQAITEDRFIETLRQAKLLNIPDVMPSVCIPHCPNKETDANKCEWRGHTCFLCDMQTDA